MLPEPTYFASPDEFRSWLEQHHKSTNELWVGFWKSGSGKPSMTWPESVDEALCFGWIDALRRSLGKDSYMIRFFPRKIDSAWSAVNLRKVEELIDSGRMRPEGLAVYEGRKVGKRHGYTYSGPDYELELGPEEEGQMRAAPGAWEFFESQPPSYRKQASRWVMSAVRPETRKARLMTLLEDSAAGRRIAIVSKYRSRSSDDPR